MQKIKTIRSAAKRFRKTGNGNFKHKRTNLSHLLTKKSTKRKRQLRIKTTLSKSDLNSVAMCLPYV